MPRGSPEQSMSSDRARAHLAFPRAQHHGAKLSGDMALSFWALGGAAPGKSQELWLGLD